MHSPCVHPLSQEWDMQTDLVERRFLEGCKSGDSESVSACLAQGVDVNCLNGWGLRRTIRYKNLGGVEDPPEG